MVSDNTLYFSLYSAQIYTMCEDDLRELVKPLALHAQDASSNPGEVGKNFLTHT